MPLPLAAASPDLQVRLLGSGGPELTDGRASTSYLIQVHGKARLLIDTGPGSSLRFEQSGAELNDLTAILYTHFHVDHSGDLPAYIKAFYFSGRDRDIDLYGPSGNELMPSATAFVDGLFGSRGNYRYLSEYLLPGPASPYKIHTVDIDISRKDPVTLQLPGKLSATAVPVKHGPIPALAWRISTGDCSVTISGDTNNAGHPLDPLAQDTDLFIAHHAIPEQAGAVARSLHITPTEIGRIAGNARVKQLVLTHRMRRTEGQEQQTLAMIRKSYAGPVDFANDGAVYEPCGR